MWIYRRASVVYVIIVKHFTGDSRTFCLLVIIKMEECIFSCEVYVCVSLFHCWLVETNEICSNYWIIHPRRFCFLVTRPVPGRTVEKNARFNKWKVISLYAVFNDTCTFCRSARMLCVRLEESQGKGQQSVHANELQQVLGSYKVSKQWLSQLSISPSSFIVDLW